MLIGELSKRTGCSRDTIRFYEKLGLIKLDKKQRRLNNYKEYSNETAQRLLSINRAKSFGFTLSEISELIFLEEQNSISCAILSEKIGIKIDDIDRKIKELTVLKNKLIFSVENCHGNCQKELISEQSLKGVQKNFC